MEKAYKKKKIPRGLREQVWIQKVGRKFEAKCKTTWCKNKMTVFDFQAGHDIPESRGGDTTMTNLVPICSRCNLSMSNQFTFSEWCKKGKDPSKWNLFVEGLRKIWKSLDIKESGTKSPRKLTNRKVKPSK